MIRFYGLSLKEVDSLALDEHIGMLEGANRLEAEEALIGFDIATYPHTDKQGRKKLSKKYTRIATPEKAKEKPLDIHQMQGLLAMHRDKVK